MPTANLKQKRREAREALNGLMEEPSRLIKLDEKTVAGMLAQLHPENEALMAHLKQVFGDQATRLLASTTHMMSHLERLDGLQPVDLVEIQATVDLVWGDKDKVVTLSETELTASLIPQAQVHILKESRHEMDRCDIKALAAIIAGQ